MIVSLHYIYKQVGLPKERLPAIEYHTLRVFATASHEGAGWYSNRLYEDSKCLTVDPSCDVSGIYSYIPLLPGLMDSYYAEPACYTSKLASQQKWKAEALLIGSQQLALDSS